jgi:hypothetical protein
VSGFLGMNGLSANLSSIQARWIALSINMTFEKAQVFKIARKYVLCGVSRFWYSVSTNAKSPAPRLTYKEWNFRSLF